MQGIKQKQRIEAKVICDSVCTTRVTTFQVCFPRIILAETNTHGILSRNAASSRAIPVERRLDMVRNDPFTPVFWGENQKGMAYEKSVDKKAEETARNLWRMASEDAVVSAKLLAEQKVHKSIANRILEPWTWVQQIVTGTEWGNFFNLRIEEGAQDEFFELAGQMLKAYVESKPKLVPHKGWHIPFGDRVPDGMSIEDKLMVSAARLARLSYERHDGSFEVEEDIKIAQRLIDAGHMSPFGHSCQAFDYMVTKNEAPKYNYSEDKVIDWLCEMNAKLDGMGDLWFGNLRWWKPHRKFIAGENRNVMNSDELLEKWKRVRAERGYPSTESTHSTDPQSP